MTYSTLCIFYSFSSVNNNNPGFLVQNVFQVLSDAGLSFQSISHIQQDHGRHSFVNVSASEVARTPGGIANLNVDENLITTGSHARVFSVVLLFFIQMLTFSTPCCLCIFSFCLFLVTAPKVPPVKKVTSRLSIPVPNGCQTHATCQADLISPIGHMKLTQFSGGKVIF